MWVTDSIRFTALHSSLNYKKAKKGYYDISIIVFAIIQMINKKYEIILDVLDNSWFALYRLITWLHCLFISLVFLYLTNPRNPVNPLWCPFIGRHCQTIVSSSCLGNRHLNENTRDDACFQLLYFDHNQMTLRLECGICKNFIKVRVSSVVEQSMERRSCTSNS